MVKTTEISLKKELKCKITEVFLEINGWSL